MKLIGHTVKGRQVTFHFEVDTKAWIIEILEQMIKDLS